MSLSPCLLLTQSGHPLRRAECLLSEAKPTPWRRIRRFELYGRERPERSWIAASNAGFKCVDICEIRRIGSGLLLQIDLLFVRDLSTGNIERLLAGLFDNLYWNVTVATARFTLSCDHKVTGPGASPGLAILVPWPGRFRVCAPALFDTRTAPSIRNTPST